MDSEIPKLKDAWPVCMNEPRSVDVPVFFAAVLCNRRDKTATVSACLPVN